MLDNYRLLQKGFAARSIKLAGEGYPATALLYASFHSSETVDQERSLPCIGIRMEMILWNRSRTRERAIDAVIGRRREGRLVQYGRALEILEDRAVPSTGGDATVEDAATLQDLALPSLVDVPVSADMHVPSVLAELFGLEPPFSMLVPLPQFLVPAGTSTVTAGWLGPVTFTNFQVDSEQLNQLAGNLVLPDGGTPYVSPYVQAITIQTASTVDLVHFVFEPMSFEASGLSIMLSNVDMTMNFSDVPGSSLFTGESGVAAISIVSRGIDLFATGLGAVLHKANEIVDDIASSAAFRDLSAGPEETIPVAQYRLPPTFINDPTVTVSIASGARVDVNARTGAARLFGSLLAKAVSLQNSGYADLGKLLARGLRDLLARTPHDFQKEVTYSSPFRPPGSPTYVYQARVGSFEIPGMTPDPIAPYDGVIDLYVDSHTAAVHAAIVDQSAVTATDRRGQDPPREQVPPSSRSDSGGFRGPVGSAGGGEGGAKVQPRKDPRAEQEKQPTKKDDDPRPLPALLSDSSRYYRRPRYAHEEYQGSRGITSGAIGGATIQRKKKNPWAEKENERGEKPRKWDENPLPQVLPDFGLRGRDTPRSDSPSDTGEFASRRVPACQWSWWGQDLTIQILLMVTARPESDYFESFT